MAKKFANMCAWNPKTKRGVVTVAYAFLLTNVNEVILRTDAAATILSKVGCDFNGTFKLYFTQEQPYSL